MSDPLVFSDAVQHFWRTRRRQSTAQRERGESDRGARSAVTGGYHMQGFADEIIRVLVEAGVSSSDVHARRGQACLPGFYRPAKEWDIAAVSAGELLVAVQLKSHVGPSFGSNFNNRTEEAMGSALDLWAAFSRGAFGESAPPWLGYLLLLEDCAGSRQPVRVSEPHFGVLEEFRGASYARRYEIFCRRLVREGHYHGACLLLSDRDKASKRRNYAEPAPDLSASRFLSDLADHVRR